MFDTITVPRVVVEQALEALDEADLLMEHRQNIELRRSALVALRAALEQPQVEQSSVVGVIGWKNHLPNSGTVVHWTALMPPLGTKLYIHPQPPRQPLTDEEIDDLLENVIGSLPVARKLIHAIERAHGITGEQE